MKKHGLGITDLIADKREAILQLATKYGASHVRVFGSVARGEARPDSDIDFLVDFRPDYSLWDRIALVQDLEDLLGHKVDVIIEQNIRDQFRPYILQDSIAL